MFGFLPRLGVLEAFSEGVGEEKRGRRDGLFKSNLHGEGGVRRSLIVGIFL